MLNIAIVQTNNYCGCGWEYVRRLRDGITANLKIPHRFVCFTDDPNPPDEFFKNLDPCFYFRRAKHEGWWEKLHIFDESNYAPDTDQVWFFDLDTIILKDITHYSERKWTFATLRDFWRPNGLGPAVMFFDPRKMNWIYDHWRAEGFPRRGNGDQSYLQNLDQGRFAKQIPKLQEFYPGEFISYKADVVAGNSRNSRGNGTIPESAAVLCFHGDPRPHTVNWLEE